jgi:iron(III) transport system ATP-binding protein
VAQPSLLLLDEPFSNMDVIHKKQLQKVIQQIGVSLSLTCIMVSHDASELLSWADQLYLMQNGNFLQSGEPRLLYQQPLNAYCAALLGDVNLLDASSNLFPALRSFFPDTTQWMIRPENIQIGGIDGIIANGKVAAIHFMGPFSMLDVKVGEQLLKVHSDQQSFNVGDTIRLSINAAAIHPMAKG